MATKKKAAPLEETILAAGDAELDQAIDDLRGVLKSDATGTLAPSDLGLDIGSGGTDFDTPLGDVEGATDFASDTGGFGGGFESSFGGGLDDEAAGASFGDEPGAQSFDTQSFGASAFAAQSANETGSALNANLDMIMDIPIDVQIVLGSSRMQVSGLMNLTEGATIALDRRIGEAVDIVVNGRIIGRGEITVLEEDETRFGVKLIEIKGSRKG